MRGWGPVPASSISIILNELDTGTLPGHSDTRLLRAEDISGLCEQDSEALKAEYRDAVIGPGEFWLTFSPLGKLSTYKSRIHFQANK